MASHTIYEDVRDLVESEIEKLTKKDDLDEKSLMYLDKLVDIAKDSYEIEMGYEQYGNDYSQRMAYPWYANSYGDYDNRNSYQRRDGMGRYSRAYGGEPYRSVNSNSFHGGGNLAQKLEQMMGEAQTERERDAIRRVLDSM